MIYFLALVLIPWIIFEIYTYQIIRNNMQALLDRKTDQINVIERLLEQNISREEMQAYIQEMDAKIRTLKEIESSEERWKNWRVAFGGKEKV